MQIIAVGGELAPPREKTPDGSSNISNDSRINIANSQINNKIDSLVNALNAFNGTGGAGGQGNNSGPIFNAFNTLAQNINQGNVVEYVKSLYRFTGTMADALVKTMQAVIDLLRPRMIVLEEVNRVNSERVIRSEQDTETMITVNVIDRIIFSTQSSTPMADEVPGNHYDMKLTNPPQAA